MKYCARCKRIYSDGDERCPECKKQLRRIEDGSTPVYLLSASGFELQRVRAALEDNGIPCDGVHRKRNISAEAVTGYDSSESDILVPFSAYGKAYDLCVGIGAIKPEGEQEILEGGEPAQKTKTADERFEEMSGSKRTAVRVLSAILFIILVALVIYGTDAVTAFIKGLL